MDEEAYMCWYSAKKMAMDWRWLPRADSDPGSCCLATFVCFHLQDQSNWPAFQLPAADTPPLANGITQWTPGVNKRRDGWMNKCPLSFIDRRVLSSACKGSLSVLVCVCVCVFVTHRDAVWGRGKVRHCVFVFMWHHGGHWWTFDYVAKRKQSWCDQCCVGNWC